LFLNDSRFEFVETHGIDTLQHWFLDNEEKLILS